jgi:hypothetical protein
MAFNSSSRFSDKGIKLRQSKIKSNDELINAIKADKEFTDAIRGADGVSIKGEKGLSLIGPKGEDGKSVTAEEIVQQLLNNPVFLNNVKGQDGDTVAGSDGVGIKDILFKEVDDEIFAVFIRDDGTQYVSPNLKGEEGDAGMATASTGRRGLPGAGVAIGGTAGQIIVKSSSTNYATEWKDTGAVTQIEGNYTVLITDDRVEATITNEATITLPDPTTISNHQFRFINHYNSTANMVFSRTIDGVSSPAIVPGDSITIYNNGTEYMIG